MRLDDAATNGQAQPRATGLIVESNELVENLLGFVRWNAGSVVHNLDLDMPVDSVRSQR